MIGTTELLIIGGVIILLFGGSQLPKLAKGLGTFVKEFKNAQETVEETKEKITKNTKKTKPKKKVTKKA